MQKWGDILRYRYQRGTEYRDSDLTNNYIGYYTDNGLRIEFNLIGKYSYRYDDHLG